MRHRRLPINRSWIPNGVTAFSVFLGYSSIVASFEGYYLPAAWLIVVAGILDLMDGKLARKLDCDSKFGSYFDSLADVINYGVAPSLLFYRTYFTDWSLVGSLVSFLPIMCSAVRLARFNVLSEETGSNGFFVGLPTTVAAAFLASYVIFMHDLLGDFGTASLAAVLLVSVSLLMISDVPYEHNGTLMRRSWKGLLTAIALCTLILFHGIALFIWVTLYIAAGFLRSAFHTVRDLDRRKQA